jgi:hypothetical protein
VRAGGRNRITIATNLNIDGRMLAQTISDHLVATPRCRLALARPTASA